MKPNWATPRRVEDASGRIPESGISITLTIVGWLSIAGGCLAVIVWIVAESTTADGGSAMELGAAIAGLISGVLFIALGAIVQRLYEIERHLRPAVVGVAEAPTALCPCGQMTAQRAKERGHLCG